MECYEGAKMIKTFRGKIAHNNQDTIVLHTNDGSIGYKVVKFQVMGITENETYESTIKIYKKDQTGSIDAVVDFSDNTLLAAILYGDTGASSIFHSQFVIFDNEIFNQDIYVTFSSITSSADMNYYIELEQMKLDLNESTVATLKDIRNIKRTATG